ncbi:ANKRD17 [Symbiodinium necroappetens]|uniref:ANKRD17 protein n=1 Tax=Symbiodinium necroappetens TaxID=1628268 RepID=A0A813C9Y3_9DINO|nr:ANKRD17 [Symbiodinium necroappetens]
MIFVNVYSDDGGCEGDDGCTYLTNILRLKPETPHHPKPSNPAGSKPQSNPQFTPAAEAKYGPLHALALYSRSNRYAVETAKLLLQYRAGTNLADDVDLCSVLPTDVQLVLLPFVQFSLEKARELRNAVQSHQVRILEDMLLEPADPNMAEDPESPPLFVAAIEGHEEITRLLLEAGSALHAGDAFTPLCAACYLGHAEVVSLLLEAGAEKDEIRADGTPLTWAAGGPIDRQKQLKQTVDVLLQSRADVNKVDGALHTPLTASVEFGRSEVVKILLSASAETSVLCPGTEQSPLCLASERGDVQTLHVLLEAGVDKDEISARRTPLTSAVAAGEREAVQALSKAGANLNKVDGEFYTPLTRAFWGDHHNILSLLLSANADVDLVCPWTSQTPLCNAARTGRVEMVRLLLLAGAALERRSLGSTPLTLAASAGHVEIVRLLIIAGAALDRVDRWRYTALNRARQRNHHEVTRLLLLAETTAV